MRGNEVLIISVGWDEVVFEPTSPCLIWVVSETEIRKKQIEAEISELTNKADALKQEIVGLESQKKNLEAKVETATEALNHLKVQIGQLARA